MTAPLAPASSAASLSRPPARTAACASGWRRLRANGPGRATEEASRRLTCHMCSTRNSQEETLPQKSKHPCLAHAHVGGKLLRFRVTAAEPRRREQATASKAGRAG